MGFDQGGRLIKLSSNYGTTLCAVMASGLLGF
jgi:hypothetical protein